MGDFLDFMAISDEEVLSGSYYSKRPKTPQDVSHPFMYDIVDESNKYYAKLLGEIQTEKTVQTIKTNDDCGFKIKGYVVTQEGTMWQIDNVVKRLVKADNKQALRWLKQTVETEYVIRLLEVENPWGLK